MGVCSICGLAWSSCLKNSTWSAVNLQKTIRPQWGQNLSWQFGHMILVSGYLVSTGVNWPLYGCPILISRHGQTISWSMVATLHDVIDVGCTCQRSLTLAMLTMKKSYMDFLMALQANGAHSERMTRCFQMFTCSTLHVRLQAVTWSILTEISQ